jgi:hypothetical protein
MIQSETEAPLTEEEEPNNDIPYSETDELKKDNLNEDVNCNSLLTHKPYYLKIKFVDRQSKREAGDLLLKIELLYVSTNIHQIPNLFAFQVGDLAIGECLANFRILRIVAMNINMQDFTTRYLLEKYIYKLNPEQNLENLDTRIASLTIGNIFKPGTLMWGLLGRDGIIQITKREPIVPKEEDQPIIDEFLSLFPDYPKFKQFLDTNLSVMSPREYELYYKYMSPLDFTTRAPSGYSFLDIPRDATITDEVLFGTLTSTSNTINTTSQNPSRIRSLINYVNPFSASRNANSISTGQSIFGYFQPFFAALKYILTRINHFSPSIERPGIKKSEQSYFFMIDRLIYYYDIFNKFWSLSDIEKSAVIIIFTHGEYTQYLNTRVTRPLQNVFICTKSAPGAVSFDYCRTDYITPFLSRVSELMYENLVSNSFVSFDRVVLAESQYQSSWIQANPKIEINQFAKSMQHYINPQTHKYTEKQYTTDDQLKYVIDVVEFINASGSSIEDKLRQSNLLEQPDFKNYLGKETITSFYLSNIVNYFYENKKKRNLFIYDRSCGSLVSDSNEDILKVKKYYESNDYVEPPLQNFIRSRTKALTDVMATKSLQGFGGGRGRKSKRMVRSRSKKTKKHKRDKRHKMKISD